MAAFATVFRLDLGDPLAMSKIQAGALVTWIGCQVDVATGGAQPKEDKRTAALTLINDILENMDIKLDPMFISSLIHDLIKVCMTFVCFIRRKMIFFDLIHRV